MQPNQPVGSPAPGQNPYDFIMNPGKPPKKPVFGGNSSLTKRLVVVVGGAIVLVILITVVTSLLSSGGSNISSLKSLVAQQQELARVAALGADSAQDSTIRSKALVTKLSLTTQQQKLTSYLESYGISLTKEELAASKDDSVDKALQDATSSNRFDEAFDEELTSQLNDYALSLQNAYSSTSNDNGKIVLSDSFTSTAYILGLK